jgi:hypothetical protein
MKASRRAAASIGGLSEEKAKNPAVSFGDHPPLRGHGQPGWRLRRAVLEVELSTLG